MDYRAMVNPTYITAKTSLFLLAGAGNEDARGDDRGAGDPG